MAHRAAGVRRRRVSFLRTHGGNVVAQRVAEFLLLDRLFPRSALHALTEAEECLEALAPSTERAGMADAARRPIGQGRTRLEYADAATLLDDLPAHLRSLQRACAAASAAVTARYFDQTMPVTWAHEGCDRVGLAVADQACHRVHLRRYRARVLQRGPDDAVDGAQVDPLFSQVECTPGATTWRYWDYWGTQVTVFDLAAPASATAGDRDQPGRDLETGPMWTPPPTGPSCVDSPPADSYVETLASPAAGRDRRLLAGVAVGLADGRTPAEAAHAVARWVQTNVGTCPARPASAPARRMPWSLRKGVCQDLAHLTLGMLRGTRHPGPLRLRLSLSPPRWRRSVTPSPGQSARLGRVVDRRLDRTSAPPTAYRRNPPRHRRPAARDYADVTPLKGSTTAPPAPAWASRVEMPCMA